MTETISTIKQAESQDTAVLDDFPIEGMGKRAMGCKMYDKCLYKAAVADWDSFNCDGCEYEGQGALEFIDSAFIPMLEASEFIYEDDLETQLVDLTVSCSPIFFLEEDLGYNDHAA
ncbi:MAG: hypothetical protein KKF12_18490 [Proteobacteria bacterium]|nr:hypothetical protein [Desulfobacula sp.]MBU3952971.1 hypothetical protein [Pseudomonadota bacterium]MBU4132810.1 hypothetical protein [Pseudomonadota bacterium]